MADKFHDAEQLIILQAIATFCKVYWDPQIKKADLQNKFISFYRKMNLYSCRLTIGALELITHMVIVTSRTLLWVVVNPS